MYKRQLDDIDTLIGGLLRKDEQNTRLLQEQYQALREQTIRLISKGGWSEGLRGRLPMLNLHLETSSFCRIRCFLEPWEGMTDKEEAGEWKETLRRDAEELSDDGVWLYPFWGEGGVLNILAAVSEEYQAEEAEEALRALFEARGITAAISREKICHDLRLINRDGGRDIMAEENGEISRNPERGNDSEAWPWKRASGQESEDDAGIEETSETEEGAGDFILPSGKKRSTALRAVRYIEENCTKYDLSLDLVAREFHITATYLCRLIKMCIRDRCGMTSCWKWAWRKMISGSFCAALPSAHGNG